MEPRKVVAIFHCRPAHQSVAEEAYFARQVLMSSPPCGLSTKKRQRSRDKPRYRREWRVSEPKLPCLPSECCRGLLSEEIRLSLFIDPKKIWGHFV